ncbi:MAG: MaoC family dehydratase N-terminal domain-containing protein [Desulfobacteraceae bacterium]|nr:MAG: MaoC family dehydratase N-terminal domain-containing protein [Desulfobacteraceae bacterium]
MTAVDLSVIGKKTEPVVFEYTWKDVVLYALGVGASAEELPFVYENTPGGLKVLPSFCVVPAVRAYPRLGDNIDFSRFLHGEQTVRLFRSMPYEGRIIMVGEVKNIYDKGKAALYHIQISGHTEDGSHIFDTYWTNFYVGAGGFGGDPGPKSVAVNPPPDQEPDVSISYEVAANQAALYRLNGDLNPLHLVPGFAKRGGFDRPILHGLCTYGFAVRAIVNGVLDGDVERFQSFKARFSNVVYPEDILTTQCWHDNGRYIVQVETARGVVISNAFCEIA